MVRLEFFIVEWMRETKKEKSSIDLASVEASLRVGTSVSNASSCSVVSTPGSRLRNKAATAAGVVRTWCGRYKTILLKHKREKKTPVIKYTTITR